MEQHTAIAALGALAHPIRLDAFRALVIAGPDGLTPGTLVDRLDVPYAKLGFHLKDLVAAGLVTQQPSGRHMIYRAAYPQMNALLGYLTDNCCAGSPCATDPSKAACGC